MGAGKQEPPPPPNAEPVVLGMVLHCAGCAKKVRKSIHRMPGTHPPTQFRFFLSLLPSFLHFQRIHSVLLVVAGVVSVVADPATNTVVVAGTADAAALKARIEDKTKKPVQILSANKPPPPDKQQQGGEDKKNSDKGDKAGAAQPQPQPQPKLEEEEESKLKKQPPPAEEKKQFQVGTQSSSAPHATP